MYHSNRSKFRFTLNAFTLLHIITFQIFCQSSLVTNSNYIKPLFSRLIDNDWDLDGLHLISGWQNLETLHVRNVACEDGQVLIEIGKRCKNLHKFSLLDVWFGTATNNKIALSGMLEYCRNLRDLTIKCSGVDQAELFASCAKNVELERIEVINDRTEQSVASLAPWISSLENMIRQCSKLTTIICDAIFKSQRDCDMAVAAVER